MGRAGEARPFSVQSAMLIRRMASDPFNLQRFVDAQGGGVYEQALSEIKAGEKRSHWMWFIFPQSAELGRSATAKHYGLSGEEEARAYLAHPVLGDRYRACVAAVRAQVDAGRSLEAIFGALDARKLGSSVALILS
jgi:uncharacterized protein (DUF1810 family)